MSFILPGFPPLKQHFVDQKNLKQNVFCLKYVVTTQSYNSFSPILIFEHAVDMSIKEYSICCDENRINVNSNFHNLSFS